MITIITATLNASRLLPFTIRSIRGQTYRGFQWIVIDGASDDGTLDLIKQNEDIIDHWISEPDDGIYDAWNKACSHIKGEWALFIGAGDELGSATVLEETAAILKTAYPEYEIVYGKIQRISKKTRAVVAELGQPWTEMKGRWEFFQPVLPVHPAVFHHRTLLSETTPFDTRFKFGSDQHLLLKHIRHKAPLYIPVVIDRMLLGGGTSQISNALAIAREYWEMNEELGIVPPFQHRLYEYFRLYSKIAVNRILPDRTVGFIIDTYRRITGRPPIWTVE